MMLRYDNGFFLFVVVVLSHLNTAEKNPNITQSGSAECVIWEQWEQYP